MPVAVILEFDDASLGQYDQVMEKMVGITSAPSITFQDVHGYVKG